MLPNRNMQRIQGASAKVPDRALFPFLHHRSAVLRLANPGDVVMLPVVKVSACSNSVQQGRRVEALCVRECGGEGVGSI